MFVSPFRYFVGGVVIGVTIAAVYLFGTSYVFKNIQERDTQDAVVSWYELQVSLLESHPTFTPPSVSRVFAYTGIALYETVFASDEAAYSFSHHIMRPATRLPRDSDGYVREAEGGVPQLVANDPAYNTVIDIPVAVNAALAEITRKLFPQLSNFGYNQVSELEEKQHKQLGRELDDKTVQLSRLYGYAIANEIAQWATYDNLATSSDALVLRGPETWLPTPPFFIPPMQPLWGSTRRHMVTTIDCPRIEPLAFSTEETSDFYKDMERVYALSKNLTTEQQQVAQIWEDSAANTSTPPGHWIAITNQIVRERSLDIKTLTNLYTALGVAMADSFTSAWDMKYYYLRLRPIAYIQKYIDPNWSSYLVTPPHPDYPGGHSTVSAAAATILTGFFGSEVTFTDRTNILYNNNVMPARTFTSFSAAAEEASMSRIYGGIHTYHATEAGYKTGTCVAEKVLAVLGQE